MSAQEREEKEIFRLALEKLCHEVCAADPERIPQISLEPFGSFQSGFATAGSDMDLVIVVRDNNSSSACFSLLEDDLPRALEKKLLQTGFGARLLTRTRVPILKVCEKPDGSFLDKLREERWKWDDLPNEKKYPHLHANEGEAEEDVQAEDPNASIVTVVRRLAPPGWHAMSRKVRQLLRSFAKTALPATLLFLLRHCLPAWLKIEEYADSVALLCVGTDRKRPECFRDGHTRSTRYIARSTSCSGFRRKYER